MLEKDFCDINRLAAKHLETAAKVEEALVGGLQPRVRAGSESLSFEAVAFACRYIMKFGVSVDIVKWASKSFVL